MEQATLLKLLIKSPAFATGETIPNRFTCDGENINPELELDNLPPETRSLAVIVDDPDAPTGNWTHWLVWDIAPGNSIEENSEAGTMGINDFRTTIYQGPCPPIGTHRYYFRVYALDKMLGLPVGSTREEMLKAMEYHIIGSGELMGLYSHTAE